MSQMAAKLPTKLRARLEGHTGAVHAVTFSSGSGQYILSGSSDRSVKLWNPAKAEPLIQSYTGSHLYEILSLAVSSDNSRFLSGGGDKSAFLWDVTAGRTLRRLGGGPGSHAGKIESVAFAGEGDSVVVTGSYDSTVRLWDIKASGIRPMMVLSEGRDSISDVAVAGHEVGMGSVDGRVRWYDMRMGKCTVDVLGAPVTSISSTAQGESMLVSTLDSKLRLLDRANGKLLQSFSDEKYTNTTYRCRSTLGANDALAVAGSEDGHVYAWDVLTGELVARVEHGADEKMAKSSKRVVSAVTYNERTGDWASAGGDGTVAVWSEVG